MKNIEFLAIAYMVIWGGLFLYLAFVSGQQKRLSQRLRRLEELLEKKGD